MNNILSFLQYIDIQISYYKSTELVIPQNIFIDFFTSKKYIKYKEILKDLEILSNIPYKNGQWYSKDYDLSKLYRIHNNYINNNNLCLVILDEPRYKKSIEYICEITDIDNRYENTIYNIDIDIKSAIEAELEYYKNYNIDLKQLRTRISKIFYTKQKRYIKFGTNVNRIFHSFSNISKVSRKHFNVNFNNIDVKNSQPLLLVAYLIKNNKVYDDNYKTDCENGLFYEQFYDIYNGENINKNLLRNKIKESLYTNIFFGFNVGDKYNKRFKELYPKTWSALLDISNTEKTLAHRLQNLEAELFNNLVPKKSKYYFTLFDAIYFTDLEDYTHLQREIEMFFNNLGINVKTELNE